MSSLIECIAESQNLFLNGWTDTELQIDGLKFSNDGLEKYIQIRYIPTDDSSLLGRTISYGVLQVYCYHKVKNLSAVLADDVREFANDKDLPKGIRLNCGKYEWVRELDNGYWCTLVQFPLAQFV